MIKSLKVQEFKAAKPQKFKKFKKFKSSKAAAGHLEPLELPAGHLEPLERLEPLNPRTP